MIASGVVRVDDFDTETAESAVEDVPAPQVLPPLPARNTDVELPTAVESAAVTVTVHETTVADVVGEDVEAPPDVADEECTSDLKISA